MVIPINVKKIVKDTGKNSRQSGSKAGKKTPTDRERGPLPGAGNQQVARPPDGSPAGSRAQGRFRAVAARPGARIVGRFLSEFPRPPRVVRDMLTGLPFVRSCFLAYAKKQGWGLSLG